MQHPPDSPGAASGAGTTPAGTTPAVPSLARLPPSPLRPAELAVSLPAVAAEADVPAVAAEADVPAVAAEPAEAAELAASPLRPPPWLAPLVPKLSLGAAAAAGAEGAAGELEGEQLLSEAGELEPSAAAAAAVAAAAQADLEGAMQAGPLQALYRWGQCLLCDCSLAGHAGHVGCRGQTGRQGVVGMLIWLAAAVLPFF